MAGRIAYPVNNRVKHICCLDLFSIHLQGNSNKDGISPRPLDRITGTCLFFDLLSTSYIVTKNSYVLSLVFMLCPWGVMCRHALIKADTDNLSYMIQQNKSLFLNSKIGQYGSCLIGIIKHVILKHSKHVTLFKYDIFDDGE